MSSTIESNTHLLEKLCILTAQGSQLNKKVKILNALSERFQREFPRVAEKIREFASQVLFDEKSPVTEQIGGIADYQKRFIDLIQQLDEHAEECQKYMRQEIESEVDLEQRELLGVLEKKVNRWFCGKRKYRDIPAIVISDAKSFEPPTKKRTLEAPELLKTFPLIALPSFRIEAFSLEMDVLKIVTREDENGEVVFAALDKNGRLHSLEGTQLRVFGFKDAAIEDYVIGNHFAVIRFKQEMHVYGNAPHGSLSFMDRPLIGKIPLEYVNISLQDVTQIALFKDCLCIGTQKGYLALFNFSLWQNLGQSKSHADFGRVIFSFERKHCDVEIDGAHTQREGSPARNGPILSMAVNSHYLVAGTSTQFTLLLNLKDETLFCYMGHTDAVTAVALSKTHFLMYSGSNSGLVNIWDLNSRTRVNALQFSGTIRQIECDSAGAFILVEEEEKSSLYYFDENTQTSANIECQTVLIQKMAVHEKNACTSLVYLATGTQFMKLSFERKLKREEEMFDEPENSNAVDLFEGSDLFDEIDSDEASLHFPV